MTISSVLPKAIENLDSFVREKIVCEHKKIITKIRRNVENVLNSYKSLDGEIPKSGLKNSLFIRRGQKKKLAWVKLRVCDEQILIYVRIPKTKGAVKRVEQQVVLYGTDLPPGVYAYGKPIITKGSEEAESNRVEIEHEQTISSKFNSERIVSMDRVTKRKKPYKLKAVRSPWFKEGTLENLFEKGKLQFEDALRIFIDIMTGVQKFHKQNYAHLDLKPENVLIGKEAEKLRAALTDFGRVSELNAVYDGAVGSLIYTPPEMFNSQWHPNFSMDIWSAGIIGYELFKGKDKNLFRFKEDVNFETEDLRDSSRFRSIRRQWQLLQQKIVKDLDETPINTLLKKMLSTVPEDRPTAQEVLDRLADCQKE